MICGKYIFQVEFMVFYYENVVGFMIENPLSLIRATVVTVKYPNLFHSESAPSQHQLLMTLIETDPFFIPAITFE